MKQSYVKNIFPALLVFFLLYCTALSAQTYTLGSGVAVNNTAIGTGTTYPAAFTNIDGAQHQQYLILASELTALGASAGNITQLAFYMVAKNTNTAARNTLNGYTLSLKQTAAPSITAYDVAGLTQMYTGNYVPATTNAWNAIPFTSCFAWDGTSNILVDLCHNSGATKATAGATTQYSTLSFNASIYTAAGLCGSSAGGTASVQRPNMQLTIQKKDAAAQACNLAGSTIILNQFSPINITIKNNSCNTITTAQVGYKFNSAPAVTETFNGSIAPGGTAVYAFIAPVDPFALGFANLKVWVSLPDGVIPDATPSNDTLPITNCFVINDPTSTNTAYTGTDFWVGFMQNDDNGVANPLYQILYLSTAAGTTNVTISTPNLSPVFTTTVTVTSNSITAVQIPNTVGSASTVMATPTANAVSNTGIHITGSNAVPFTVYGLSRELYTADGYLAIPTTALGRDYFVVAPLGIYSSSVLSGTTNLPAEIMIVATQSGTTATIKLPPGIPIVGHAAGSTFTTPVLNAGQTYLIQALPSGGVTFDLSGTRVTGNNPIMVLEGSVCPNIGFLNGTTLQTNAAGGATPCGYCDHVNEVAMPISSWGQTYYLDNFALKAKGSIVRIVNAVPGVTNFTFTGLGPQTLTGAGSYKDYIVKNAAEIIADNPIYVVEMCTGSSCDNGTYTDPFITNIIPKEQWGNAYSFSCPTAATQSFLYHFVNVFKKGPGQVALDGTFLPNALYPGSFTQLGTTGIYYGTFTLPAAGGFHTLISDSAISAYVYGYTTDDAYGYPASGAFLAPIASVPVKLVSFNGVKDQGHAILTWTTASEINNNYYAVERSADGITFSEIGRVSGSGNSTASRNYAFTDAYPLSGINYYRLKQVDYDGKFNYFNTISLNFLTSSLQGISVTPVPAANEVTVSFNAGSGEGEGSYTITDIAGRKMSQGRIRDIQAGANTQKIDISELPSGVYFVSLEKDGNKSILKLVKEE